MKTFGSILRMMKNRYVAGATISATTTFAKDAGLKTGGGFTRGRGTKMKVDCNRIMVDGRDLCIVKDSCLGCKINSERCAINDLLEDAGILKDWESWDLPNFRERTEEQKWTKN